MTTTLLAVIVSGCATTPRCESFDSLAVGARITVSPMGTNPPAGGTFQPPNGDFAGREFTAGNNTTTTSGFSEVGNGGRAGGAGNELEVNNITLVFGANTGQVLKSITVRFGEYGGNLNLRINNDFRNFRNFADVHGTTIGGVNVSVLSGGNGNDSGTIKFTGTIQDQGNWGHLAIGGQEFWIDDLCWTSN